MAKHQLYKELLWACEPLLTPRENDVLRRYYDEGDTLKAIGNTYGVTRERISQIRHKALGKLRRALRAYLLDE